MQCIHNMASSEWFCGLVHRKEVTFVILLLQLGLLAFSSVSRLSRVRDGVRTSVKITVSLVLMIGWG